MFGLFSSNKRSLSWIIVIESSAAEGFVVDYNGPGLFILGRAEERIIHEKRPNGEDLTHGMIKSFQKVLNRLSFETSRLSHGTHYFSYPQSVDIVACSPWVHTQMISKGMKFNKISKINYDTVNNFVKDIGQSFYKTYESGKYDKDFEFDVDVIENKVSRVSINGYEVDPHGEYNAREISVQSMISAMPLNLTNYVRDSLLKATYHSSIDFHSSYSLEYAGAKLAEPHIKDCFLINVHGELTDSIFVRNGMPEAVSTIPLGTHEMIRTVASQSKISNQIAMSYMRSVAQGITDNTLSDKVKKSINNISQKWKDDLMKSIRPFFFSNIPEYPIYINAAPFTNLFIDALSSEQGCAKSKVLPMSDKKFEALVRYPRMMPLDGLSLVRLVALDSIYS